MLSLEAPAKINWFLLVLGGREDGYHEIQSLMQRVSLADSLTFEESQEIEVVTDSGIPEEDNLVLKAATALKNKTGIRKGARISLMKRIPIAAGLGGGSSDAACTLTGLNRLWGLGLPKHELMGLASGLGSDVPFFLGSPSAVAEGRGEILTPVGLGRPLTLLLVKPHVGISAQWAYSGVTELTKTRYNIKIFSRAFEGGDFSSLGKIMRNDLEGPVFGRYPEVRLLKEKLLENGALLSAMSGSGATVFGVFGSRDEAGKAEESLQAHWSAVVETIV
jgi:4-diphosphocytidyl-2-C-methyl-D-erythritol kinase